MQVQVRFFAALRERAGTPAMEVSVPEGATVAQVWGAAVLKAHSVDNVLAARNMQYVGFDCLVESGDEIAFFPPVTGGAR